MNSKTAIFEPEMNTHCTFNFFPRILFNQTKEKSLKKSNNNQDLRRDYADKGKTKKTHTISAFFFGVVLVLIINVEISVVFIRISSMYIDYFI